MSSTPPQPIRIGGNNSVLRCSMEQCPFYCRSYVNFEGHLERRHFCMDCAKYYHDVDVHQCLMKGLRQGHSDANSVLDLTNFYEFSRSHGGSLVCYKYKNALKTPDVETTFVEVEAATKKLLRELYNIHTLSKVELSLRILMEKEVVEEDGTPGRRQATIYFKSPHYELQTAGAIKSILLDSASEIIEKKNSFIENGSGWYIVEVSSFEVKIGEIRLFMNSRASGYLEMPFKSRQGYINFKNKDSHCFKYCIAAGVFMNEQMGANKKMGLDNKNLSCPKTWEKYFSRLDFSSTKGSVNIYNDLNDFEEKNKISVNVLSHRKEDVVIIRTSKVRYPTVITLFLIHKRIGNYNAYHLTLITSLNIFLRFKSAKWTHFCERCFRHFGSENKSTEHAALCKTGESEIIETFPKEGEMLKFNRPELTLAYPYVLYWDFECYSVEVPDKNILGTSTTIDKKFEPASYSLCIVHNNGDSQSIYALECYDSDRPVEHFFERVFKHAEDILWSIRTTNNFVVPTVEETERHNNATHCDFCQREITNESSQDGTLIDTSMDEDMEETLDSDICIFDDDIPSPPKTKRGGITRCYHHCHNSGRYINTLCLGCNLKVKFKHELVCVAHNSAGFDFHLLMKHLDSPLFDVKDISVISKGTEKFVQLEIPARDKYVPSTKSNYNRAHTHTKGWVGNRKVKLRFIDSCQFLQNKLANLAMALKKENASTLNLVHECIPYIMRTEVGSLNKKIKNSVNQDDVNLLFEKLPFPYTYLSSSEILTDGVAIPGREFFNNELTNEKCTDEEWVRVKRVCESFNITGFREFTRLYTIIDKVLLAVIWENFRRQGIEMYNLDPCYMCTGSGYSWQCFLYKSKAEVEYIRDREMIKFLSNGVRGGTSFCTRKIQTANNERAGNYDPEKEKTHLIYLDKVSLYATALLDKFPHSNYNWVEKEKLELIDWTKYNGEDGKGYILQVTLGYPPEVQDKTVDLPLAPEKRVIQFEELSTRQKCLMSTLGNTTKRSFMSQPRLLLHCYDRVEYTVHYRALKYYLLMGLTLLEIHKGISFTEKAYFRDYIQFNIERRQLALSESMRQFLKSQNNNVYGKCLESYKNNTRIRFCDSRSHSRHMLSLPECVDFLSISENISIVMLRPKSVKLNKPTAAGFTVLDLAKVIFYEGYYQQLKKVFGERIYNLYMDTDSSISIIKDPQNTFWDDLAKYRDYFDFSKIPENHDFFRNYAHLPELRKGNAGVSGKWKVEAINLKQAILLKPKQYSLLYFNDTEEMKSKGIPYSSLKTFSHEQFKDVVLNNTIVKMNVKYIRSVKHTLYCITVDKVGFHGLDITRIYPKADDINYSLPLGHYKLKETIE